LKDRRSKASRLATRQKVQIVTTHGPPTSATIAARVQGNANAHSLPGSCSGHCHDDSRAVPACGWNRGVLPRTRRRRSGGCSLSLPSWLCTTSSGIDVCTIVRESLSLARTGIRLLTVCRENLLAAVHLRTSTRGSGGQGQGQGMGRVTLWCGACSAGDDRDTRFCEPPRKVGHNRPLSGWATRPDA
jgi:hypothetical protein